MEEKDRFTIALASGVSMEVQPVWLKDDIKEFDIYVAEKYHCTIYPDTDDAFIYWKSKDDIAPELVTMIGRSIDKYYDPLLG